MWKLHCTIITLMAAACLGVSSLGVPFTEVANATQRRAVCLDGSPAGYYYSAGSGDGAKNWLIYLRGGGWCQNIDSCQSKQNQSFGCNRFLPPFRNLTGILSPNNQINPDCNNWNRIYVGYCDQSSFLGDNEFDDGQGLNLQFRGSRIFDAVVDDLLAKGMSVGENAILSGDSAGALGAILHCDGFRARLPDVGRVKCLSDAGFFLRGEKILNADYRDNFFASTIMFHNISSFLPVKCTERIDPSLCLFPENLVGDIQTPLFILNSAFDIYQTLGGAFFKALREISNNPSRGMFIEACFSHAVAYDERYWSPNSTIKLGNLTIQEAFANWYFDRDSVTLVTTPNFLETCNKK